MVAALRKLAFVAALVIAVLALPASGASRSETRCFGAAARDPAHPCRDATSTVVPDPAVARTLPNAPCTAVERDAPMVVCAFGVPAAEARATVALVGDSHAGGWRAALEQVARANGWRGLSITHTSCP